MSNTGTLITVSCREFLDANVVFLSSYKSLVEKYKAAKKKLKETPAKGFWNRVFKTNLWELHYESRWYISKSDVCSRNEVTLSLNEILADTYPRNLRSSIQGIADGLSASKSDTFQTSPVMAEFIVDFLEEPV